MRRLAKYLILGGAFIAVSISAVLWASASPARSESGAAPEPGGQITVHGHWIIEVRDPDGSVADRVEFDNHLEASGARLLARLLRGDMVSGVWNIQLWSVGDQAQLCFISSANQTPTVCNLHTPSFTPLPGGTPTLDVQYGTAAFDGALMLTGAVVADRTGVVSRVVTQSYGCLADVTRDDCVDDYARSSRSGPDADFTETTIEPLQVIAGQEVDVTVVISFS